MKNLVLISLLITILGIITFQFIHIHKLKTLLSSQQELIFNLNVKIKETEQDLNDLKDLQRIHPIEQKVQECMKKNNYTTAGMSQCVNDSAADWSDEINKYILLFKKNLPKGQFALLQDAQSQWTKYKLAEYKFLNSVIGEKSGSIYINILSGSKVDVIEGRAKDLTEIYDIVFSLE